MKNIKITIKNKNFSISVCRIDNVTEVAEDLTSAIRHKSHITFEIEGKIHIVPYNILKNSIITIENELKIKL